MRAPWPYALLVCAASAASLLGCALTSKSAPIEPRYFSPERPDEAPRAGQKSSGPPLELRLGRVAGASHLQERLVFRDSAYELGYYEERRWTESPEQYLKRRLLRVLFEERGLRHVVGGTSMTLDVELAGFEEIRAPKHLAHVQLLVSLHDQRVVRWEQTLTVDQPVAAASKGDDADKVVEALGLALRAAVDQIAERVVSELGAPPDAAAAAAAAGTGERR